MSGPLKNKLTYIYLTNDTTQLYLIFVKTFYFNDGTYMFDAVKDHFAWTIVKTLFTLTY